jgi:hypothetical protein
LLSTHQLNEAKATIMELLKPTTATDEMLSIQKQIRALQERQEAITSMKSNVGYNGEFIVAQHLGATLTTGQTKGFDALKPNGDKVEKTVSCGYAQLTHLDTFDLLAILEVDRDAQPIGVHLVTSAQVHQHAKDGRKDNKWSLKIDHIRD